MQQPLNNKILSKIQNGIRTEICLEEYKDI